LYRGDTNHVVEVLAIHGILLVGYQGLVDVSNLG
jgi:hypothetical protein